MKSDRVESRFRTPPTMKSLVTPPVLKLPSFDNDDDDEMPTKTNIENKKKKNQDYSSICVDLNKLFDAAADTAENKSC